jgi:hypothetical protein
VEVLGKMVYVKFEGGECLLGKGGEWGGWVGRRMRGVIVWGGCLWMVRGGKFWGVRKVVIGL